ncbi:hypothetical protein LZ554_005941 [Drepanopeziza brunnea f. sp. 'monogermtubi']|nr:hypothetical protein LZ554_005941 [Drepanopeziza brunnea f. sp. 'monogermtubi']
MSLIKQEAVSEEVALSKSDKQQLAAHDRNNIFGPLLGRVSTQEQVASAAHLLMTTHYGGEGLEDLGALKRYIKNQPRSHWRWLEIEIYQHFGQITPYFFESNLDEKQQFCEDIRSSVRHWAHLSMEGALGQSNGSSAEMFRAYIRSYITKAEVEKWDQKSIRGLNQEIYKDIENLRRGKGDGTFDPDVDKLSEGSPAIKDEYMADDRSSSSYSDNTEPPPRKRALSTQEDRPVSKITRLMVPKQPETSTQHDFIDLTDTPDSPIGDIATENPLEQSLLTNLSRIQTRLEDARTKYRELKTQEISLADNKSKVFHGHKVLRERTCKDFKKLMKNYPLNATYWTLEGMQTEAACFRDFGLSTEQEILRLGKFVSDGGDVSQQLGEIGAEIKKLLGKKKAIMAAMEALRED